VAKTDTFTIDFGALVMTTKRLRAPSREIDRPAPVMTTKRLRKSTIALVDERPAVSIVSVTVLSDTSIRVNFNRGATDNEALSASANYVITPSLSVLSATPEPVASPSYVVLTTREMVDGETYTLAIKRVDPDAALPDITATFTGQGTLPTFAAVSCPADRTVRVTFSEPMDPSSGVLDLGNYTLTAGVGAVTRSISSVQPDDVDGPSYVDLTLDGEMTIGTANYMVEVDAGFTDAVGNPIDGSLSRTFDGRGTRPFIADARTSETEVAKLRVIFSEAVKQVSAGNANDALNPANYTITGPSTVTVTGVASLSSSMVELSVVGQRAGLGRYTVQVENVEDLANNAVEV